MRGDPVPPTDNLALHCQPNSGIEVNPEGQPVGVTREAFRVDDDGISTNWIEYDNGDFSSVCLILASIRTVRKSHRVGLLTVADTIAVGQATNKAITVEHDPIDVPPNPGHALIKGVAPTDEPVLDELALYVVIREFSPASLQAR